MKRWRDHWARLAAARQAQFKLFDGMANREVSPLASLSDDAIRASRETDLNAYEAWWEIEHLSTAKAEREWYIQNQHWIEAKNDTRNQPDETDRRQRPRIRMQRRVGATVRGQAQQHHHAQSVGGDDTDRS